MDQHRPPSASRSWRVGVNRLVASILVPAALASIVVTSRLRPQATRRMALRWIKLATRLTGVHLESCGLRSLQPDGLSILVANHSSPLDIAALILSDPSVAFVAAADLFRVPMLAGAMRAMNTIPVDRRSHNRGQLAIPPGWLERQQTLVIFPEGGIPAPGQRRPFHRSAFALAIEHGAVILPVAIHGSDAVLPPGAKLGLRPGVVAVEYLAPIRTEGLTLSDRHSLCDRAEDRIIAALHSRRAAA
jgi:1-acyl-sn-glycerol-3-phosphate acyltransferase